MAASNASNPVSAVAGLATASLIGNGTVGTVETEAGFSLPVENARLGSVVAVSRYGDNIVVTDASLGVVRGISQMSGLAFVLAGEYEPPGGDPFALRYLAEPVSAAETGLGRLLVVVRGGFRTVLSAGVGVPLAYGSGSAGLTELIGGGDQAPLEWPLFRPAGLAHLDEHNRLVVADTGNHVLRATNESAPGSSRRYGTGLPGYGNGVDEPLAFSSPAGLAVVTPAVDGGGPTVLIADAGNDLVRLLDLTTGTTTRVAGGCVACGYADGGVPLGTTLNAPRDVAVSGRTGDVFIADTGNHVIRWISGTSGLIGLLAGLPQVCAFELARRRISCVWVGVRILLEVSQWSGARNLVENTTMVGSPFPVAISDPPPSFFSPP